jgi:bifunctional DNA-binding transcriptional regulator/antitoxin component of YhaV-PrlF toxin-antitoxin module
MKTGTIYVKVDSRNRVTIPKEIAKGLSHLYKIYEKKGRIILEPISEIPERERWLFEPKNKAILEELKKALKQKADRDINLDDFDL